jgi:transketolase C-terminal domain/subunit
MEQVALPDVFAESGPAHALYVKYQLTTEHIARAVHTAITRRIQAGRDVP